MDLLPPINKEQSNEHIIQIVLNEDELSWQQIIYQLVREQQMDPWDISITTLTKRFLDTIKKLQEFNFRISGKLVLASALLLKIKSDRLLGEDLTILDDLIQSTEDPEDIDLLDMELEDFTDVGTEAQAPPKIYPRTPQPRQRKVSVYDLVTALEQALDVQVRREVRALDKVEFAEVKVPEDNEDISDSMNNLLKKISVHFVDAAELSFQNLVPSEGKMDKVRTFIPLLHLTNERRIDIDQEEHFHNFFISLLDDTPVVYQATE